MLKEIVDRIVTMKPGKTQVRAVDTELEKLREAATGLVKLRKMLDPATDLKAFMQMKLSKYGVKELPPPPSLDTKPGAFVTVRERLEAVGKLVANREYITVGSIAVTLGDEIHNIYRTVNSDGIRHYFMRSEQGVSLTPIGRRRFIPKEGRVIRAYHGSAIKFDNFEFQRKPDHKTKHDSDGPGFYFTSCPGDATTFGKYLYTVDLRLAHTVPTRREMTRISANELISVIDELTPEEQYEVFMDWNENPGLGRRQFLEHCLKLDSYYEAFNQVWFDVFYRAGNTARYLQAMQRIGYDGAIIPKDGITHFVMFSADHIKLISRTTP